MAQYKEGTLVENKGAPQWGPGKIVHIAGDHLHILFRDIEGNVAKKLRVDTPALRLAASQSDPILDNLPPLVEKGGSWIVPGRNLTLESARQKFLHWFPAGFTDPKYRLGERDYKVEAHRAFEALLGLDEAKDLLLRDGSKFSARSPDASELHFHILQRRPSKFVLKRFGASHLLRGYCRRRRILRLNEPGTHER